MILRTISALVVFVGLVVTPVWAQEATDTSETITSEASLETMSSGVVPTQPSATSPPARMRAATTSRRSTRTSTRPHASTMVGSPAPPRTSATAARPPPSPSSTTGETRPADSRSVRRSSPPRSRG